ncbi:MAG: Fic family protein [Nanoarchaeota archaeon]
MRIKDLTRLVPESIDSQIFLALHRLEVDPRYDLAVRHTFNHDLNVEAVKHSIDIEFPKNGKKSHRGKNIKEMVKNLNVATNFFAMNYTGGLNEEMLFDTLSIIEPSVKPVAYRGLSDPMTRALGMQRIYPQNVDEQMQKFIDSNGHLFLPIDKAFHAHFHITRIHPFRDGNGRLARLVQNGMLMKAKLPPIVIETFDRRDYIDLLNNAQRSYEGNNNRNTSEVSRFYSYLGLKLRDSIIDINKRLVHKN